MDILIAGLLALLVGPIPARGQAQPSDPPGPGQLDRLYGDRIRQALSTPQRDDEIALARELVQQADLETTPAELQHALLDKACSLALRSPAGYALAETACRKLLALDGRAGGPADARLTEILELQLRTARDPERSQVAARLARQYVRQGKGLLARDEPVAANLLFRKAQALARTLEPQLVATIRSCRARAVHVQAMLARAGVMERQLQENPGDLDVRRRLAMHWLVELDRPDKARAVWGRAPDPVLQVYLPLATKDPAQLHSAACLELARWFAQLADGPSRQAKAQLLARSARYYRRYLSGRKPDQAVVRAATEELRTVVAELYQAQPSTLVIWNQHNGNHNDRGSTTVNIVLYHKDKEVHRIRNQDLPWQSGKDTYVRIDLPVVAFDRVRVEVVRFRGTGGGLAEIQLLQDGRNIAAGKPARASAAYSPAYSAARVTDKIHSSAQQGRGYWLLPDRQSGWVEIDLAP